MRNMVRCMLEADQLGIGVAVVDQPGSDDDGSFWADPQVPKGQLWSRTVDERGYPAGWGRTFRVVRKSLGRHAEYALEEV